jgi:16S rRNA (cytidine1402-2'-O)-methyltransferase
MTGTLFIVATPIGNLEDITFRAVRVLREADVIAAEDTRRTAGLLSHYGIRTPTISFHEHNEHERTQMILDRLRSGARVALVTDAGTPLVSDPGSELVRAARVEGIRVEAIPGASAVLTALAASGIPVESFVFLGFAPSRAGERRTWLRALTAEPRTTVFFEAPHRVRDTLTALADVAPDRLIALARELTKVHEEILTGTPQDVLGRLVESRGEFTVVVAPPPDDADAAEIVDATDAELWQQFCALTADAAMGRREAVAALARRYGRPGREIYAALERAKAGNGGPSG